MQLNHESTLAPTSNPLDMMEELVNANEWRYDRSTDEEMIVEFTGQWCEYRMFFVWQEDLGALYFSCLFDTKITAGKRAAVAELLSYINERLWLGHFDLCSEELAPMFRHTILLRGTAGAGEPASDARAASDSEVGAAVAPAMSLEAALAYARQHQPTLEAARQKFLAALEA